MFYSLVADLRRQNWESGLFLETKAELEAGGEVERLRRWLGWLWQRLYDNDNEFADQIWDSQKEIWYQWYVYEEVKVDYETRLFFGAVDGNENDEDQLGEGPAAI